MGEAPRGLPRSARPLFRQLFWDPGRRPRLQIAHGLRVAARAPLGHVAPEPREARLVGIDERVVRRRKLVLAVLEPRVEPRRRLPLACDTRRCRNGRRCRSRSRACRFASTSARSGPPSSIRSTTHCSIRSSSRSTSRCSIRSTSRSSIRSTSRSSIRSTSRCSIRLDDPELEPLLDPNPDPTPRCRPEAASSWSRRRVRRAASRRRRCMRRRARA